MLEVTDKVSDSSNCMTLKNDGVERITRLQRKNMEYLRKEKDREYLDTFVMPALYSCLQRLLEER